MSELLKNKLGLKVLTDTGWSNFDGLVDKGMKESVVVKTERSSITCTLDHEFFLRGHNQIEAKSLKPNTRVLTASGLDRVVSVTLDGSEPVYDLFNVEHNHRFYANDILVKNCEFLIFDETLLNSISLLGMKGSDPIMKMGQARWYKKINAASTYILGLDPSLGTGGDYAAIQIIEVPSMEQVCEWHNNQTPVQSQAKVLRDLLRYIDSECQRQGQSPSIYYSIENNTIGEAALIAIAEIGEDNIPGLFLSEPIKKGHARRFRKGFNTTHASKISVCAKLKQLVESKQLTINSKELISELKTFVASGITFKAKSGRNDDLVSSALLTLRMIMLLQDWDPAIYEKMRETTGFEEHDLPMPIYISSSY